MITIAHLYYDLMNLYGESGNIKALKNCLENLGCDVKIKLLSIQDELSFDEYDFIYMGTGTEENQKLVLEHLRNYKKEIKRAYEKNKIFLMTGNAFELFGKQIHYSKQEKMDGIGLFSFQTKLETFRIVDEALMKCDFLQNPVLGFQNHSGMIDFLDFPLFTVIKGTGYKPQENTEGISQNNFYGTYLIGPLLVRNPELLKYFCNLLLKQKKISVEKEFQLELEEKAYQEFMNNYYKGVITWKN